MFIHLKTSSFIHSFIQNFLIIFFVFMLFEVSNKALGFPISGGLEDHVLITKFITNKLRGQKGPKGSLHSLFQLYEYLQLVRPQHPTSQIPELNPLPVPIPKSPKINTTLP